MYKGLTKTSRLMKKLKTIAVMNAGRTTLIPRCNRLFVPIADLCCNALVLPFIRSIFIPLSRLCRMALYTRRHKKKIPPPPRDYRLDPNLLSERQFYGGKAKTLDRSFDSARCTSGNSLAFVRRQREVDLTSVSVNK